MQMPRNRRLALRGGNDESRYGLAVQPLQARSV